jgi:ATP-dependent RNA helicase DDX3X
MRENVRLCLYDKPTAIQSFALPAIHRGKDLIGIAQTGKYLLALHFMSII